MSALQRSSGAFDLAGDGVEVMELGTNSDGGQTNLARLDNLLHHDMKMVGEVGKSIFVERRVVNRCTVG